MFTIQIAPTYVKNSETGELRLIGPEDKLRFKLGGGVELRDKDGVIIPLGDGQLYHSDGEPMRAGVAHTPKV